MPATSQSIPQPPKRYSPVDPRVDTIPWVTEGIRTGIVGAVIIAIFFFVLDLLDGKPLRTPNLLGAVIFTGASPTQDIPFEPGFVVGYTILHGIVFAGVGVLAAFECLTRTRIPGPPTLQGLVLAGALFVVFEICFVGLGALLAPSMLGVLGAGRVALANALAAGVMAGVLCVRAERIGLAPDKDANGNAQGTGEAN